MAHCWRAQLWTLHPSAHAKELVVSLHWGFLFGGFSNLASIIQRERCFPLDHCTGPLRGTGRDGRDGRTDVLCSACIGTVLSIFARRAYPRRTCSFLIQGIPCALRTLAHVRLRTLAHFRCGVGPCAIVVGNKRRSALCEGVKRVEVVITVVLLILVVFICCGRRGGRHFLRDYSSCLASVRLRTGFLPRGRPVGFLLLCRRIVVLLCRGAFPVSLRTDLVYFFHSWSWNGGGKRDVVVTC